MDNHQQRLETAFATLGDELKLFIKSLRKKGLGSKIPPEDIMGELFVYALDHPSQWERHDPENLKIYLFWKAKLLLIDRFRRQRASENIINKKGEGSEDPVIPSPSLLLHRREKQETVQAFLEKLEEPILRQAVWLCLIEGRPLREASKTLGKTPDEVRFLLQRALRHLEKIGRKMGARKFLTSGDTH